MRKILFFILIIALLTGLATGCSDDDGGAVWGVKSVSPAANSTGIRTDVKISVAFGTAFDPATVSLSTIKMFPTGEGEPGALSGTFALSTDSKTAEFTPEAGLSPLKNYTVLVKSGTNGVLSSTGTPLGSDYSAAFTTGQDTVGPRVLSVIPADGATAVYTDSSISIRFSETVDPASLTTNSVKVYNWAPDSGVMIGAPLAGTFNTNDNPLIIFTPDQPFKIIDDYKVEIVGGGSGVKDSAGNSLAAAWESAFYTANITSADAPAVTNSWPAQSATNVPTTASIELVFSKTMQQSTVSSPATVKLYPTGSPAATVTMSKKYFDNPVFVFTPSAALQPNTSYTLLVKSGTDGVKDGSTQPMAEDFELVFTTGAGADTEPLRVVAITPGTNASGVEPNASISVTFNKPVDTGTLSLDGTSYDATFIVSDHFQYLWPFAEEGNDAAATLDYSANPTITFNLNSGKTFDLEKRYYIKLLSGANGIKALTGAQLAADYTNTFTVKSPVNGTIADLRSASGVCAIRVSNVFGTFYRDTGNDYDGFFIQESAGGPGIYVVTDGKSKPLYPIYPTDTTTFPLLTITVTEVSEYQGFKQVIGYSVKKQTNTNMIWFTENMVTAVSNQTLDESFESRMLRLDGWLSNYSTGSSTANREYQFYYSDNKYLTLKIDQYLLQTICGETLAAAEGKKLRVQAPLQQDSDGYFIKPYFYMDGAQSGFSSELLSYTSNYPYMYNVVELTN